MEPIGRGSFGKKPDKKDKEPSQPRTRWGRRVRKRQAEKRGEVSKPIPVPKSDDSSSDSRQWKPGLTTARSLEGMSDEDKARFARLSEAREGRQARSQLRSSSISGSPRSEEDSSDSSPRLGAQRAYGAFKEMVMSLPLLRSDEHKLIYNRSIGNDDDEILAQCKERHFKEALSRVNLLRAIASRRLEEAGTENGDAVLLTETDLREAGLGLWYKNWKKEPHDSEGDIWALPKWDFPRGHNDYGFCLLFIGKRLGEGGQKIVYHAKEISILDSFWCAHPVIYEVNHAMQGEATEVDKRREAFFEHLGETERFPPKGYKIAEHPLKNGFTVYKMGVEYPDTAASLRARSSVVAFRQAIMAISDPAKALQWLHERVWVHRDVKPGNIFVGPKLAVLADNDECVPVEADEPYAGTPAYASPQQITWRRLCLDGETEYVIPQDILGAGRWDKKAGKLLTADMADWPKGTEETLRLINEYTKLDDDAPYTNTLKLLQNYTDPRKQAPKIRIRSTPEDDMWALGLTMWQLFYGGGSGNPPFIEREWISVADHLHRLSQDEIDAQLGLPDELEFGPAEAVVQTVIKALLRHDPKERLTSEQVVSQLDAALKLAARPEATEGSELNDSEEGEDDSVD